MKRAISIVLTLAMCVQLLLSSVTVFAENETTIKYEAPDSPATTYNMNLDWKFFQTSGGYGSDIWMAMEEAEKDGIPFYAKDYDDSAWETVSIPHAPGRLSAFGGAITDAGQGWRGVVLYRKTFTVPSTAQGGKVFFELEGIRQCAYVWVNGEKVGYYEAGITAMGFDITNYVTPGETAVIAICNDGTTARGTAERVPYETVPGETREAVYTEVVAEMEEGLAAGNWSGDTKKRIQSKLANFKSALETMTEEEREDYWGTSYTPDNYNTSVGTGAFFVWNTKEFNEPQVGLVYDAYLHVKGGVYQTLPLYNNLKTTGNYIYADNFDIREGKARINVKSEIRNETGADGSYTLEVNVVDHEGNLKYSFESDATEVKAATDAGVVYEAAIEDDVYTEEARANGVGLTEVNTPDVTYINASYEADGVRFWSIDDPYLYTVYTVLKDGNGNVVDVDTEKTGFRKVTYDPDNGVMINDKAQWLTGYAQRSTNEWAVIGIAPDWLQDYDMKLLKENNSNFIRWMHVAPKPAEVRSADKYGVAIVCPAGDKEGQGLNGRQWSQRTEAMRDAMIYFRNNPSILFWETGNSPVGSADNANEMADLRNEIDPYGMRFIGARSTQAANQLNYEYNYAGTMYGNYASSAVNAMKTNGIMGPIMETEYARDESPRRIWDRYSPPDYDYVNKYLGDGCKKEDGFDYWDLTQEEITVRNVKEYNNYYGNRAGYGSSYYSAEAMMVWSDSVMHGRNSGTENSRTSGRVDGVRQTKQMYDGTTVAKSEEPAVHIIGHWSYPEVSEDTYNYFASSQTGGPTEKGQYYTVYDTNTVLRRDPTKKTVYAVGSVDIEKIELYRIDGEEQTLIGTDASAEQNFLYQFDNIDVTKGDAVLAKAYNARGEEVATHTIARTYDAKAVKLEANVSPAGWRADGSDIAYIDVKVVDENGNVCALNYDKISFEYEGNGVYLGGYNSGIGSGCFQNTAGTTGISNYFGGAKDGVSTLGKDYVYAENGTNRIFIRSTREAGSFTLTAKMDGMMDSSITIISTAVETKGGLTTLMQSTLEPGVSAAPITTTQKPMQALMSNKLFVDWLGLVIEKVVDTNVYYAINVNGEELDTGEAKAFLGTMDSVYGPVLTVLEKLQSAGAPFTYAYDESGDAAVLEFVAGGHTYTITEGINAILTDGGTPNEIVQEPEVRDGEFFVSLSAVLGYIPGVLVAQDNANKVINITYTAQ